MDISHDLKKPKEKSEHGLEKQSRANTAPETVEVDGKIYKMPEDLKNLEEINYDDPDVKKWLAEQEAESIRLYGKLTCEEADYMYSRRLELQKEFPQKPAMELNQMALREFRSDK